jgi:GTP diphosphokinase / guanosine-3',5'-bis(diphosphate) 3'-diphosphatase
MLLCKYEYKSTHMKRIFEAIKFASIKHRDQRRKDLNNSPYVNHVLDVADLLVKAGVTDEDTIIAGLLHDTIEDTQTTHEEIKKLFGQNVLTIVLECSDDKKLDKIKRKQLQIEHANDISFAAKLVKLADKYSNLSDLLTNPPKTWKKEEIMGYAYWCFAVYKKLEGVNEVFDNMFRELFRKFNIDGKDLESELEKYYLNISSSE